MHVSLPTPFHTTLLLDSFSNNFLPFHQLNRLRTRPFYLDCSHSTEDTTAYLSPAKQQQLMQHSQQLQLIMQHCRMEWSHYFDLLGTHLKVIADEWFMNVLKYQLFSQKWNLGDIVKQKRQLMEGKYVYVLEDKLVGEWVEELGGTVVEGLFEEVYCVCESKEALIRMQLNHKKVIELKTLLDVLFFDDSEKKNRSH